MRTRSNGRGEAAQLGIAIVLVLALTSALAITSIGSVTLDESRSVAETQSGLQTMTELDSRASLVALGGGDAESLDLSSQSDDGRVTVENEGEIRFVMRNSTDNSTVWQQNVSLGAVTYENGNERIAYQGGGVWRRSAGANGSVMVSPPELHYQDGTLTLPMINVSGADRGISEARVRKVGESRIYPNVSRGVNGSNPVKEGNKLTLFVKSEYYRGWATFFEDRVGGNVTVYEDEQTVRVDLVAPEDRFKIDSGLVSVGTGSDITMKGSGGSPTFLDSYDSSDGGNYSQNKSGDGVVRSPSGIDMNGNTFVNGTVNIGGTLNLGSKDTRIIGNAFHQGLDKHQKAEIEGTEAKNGTGVSIPPIDGTVDKQVNTICDGGTTLTDSMLSGGYTLNDGGKYCYEGNLKLNGETLTFDVSDGNVSLAVDGNIDLNSGAEINVTGIGGEYNSSTDNSTKLWLVGDMSIQKSEVNVTNQQSPAFRLYGKSGTNVELTGNDAKFVGLLYAPSNPGRAGGLTMKSDADLYGSAVVGEVTMNSGSAVHYDQALGGFTFNRRSTPSSRLSYLYVTIHEIEIEDR